MFAVDAESCCLTIIENVKRASIYAILTIATTLILLSLVSIYSIKIKVPEGDSLSVLNLTTAYTSCGDVLW